MRNRSQKPQTTKQLRRAARGNVGGVLGMEEMRVLAQLSNARQTSSDSVTATISTDPLPMVGVESKAPGCVLGEKP